MSIIEGSSQDSCQKISIIFTKKFSAFIYNFTVPPYPNYHFIEIIVFLNLSFNFH